MVQNAGTAGKKASSKLYLTMGTTMPLQNLCNFVGLGDVKVHALPIFRQHWDGSPASGLPACSNSPLSGGLGSEWSSSGF